jgi:hypothetical protein
MGRPHRLDSIEIDQDIEFAHQEWGIQRIFWVIFGLILLAGFIGLLGAGPLSHAQASAGPLNVEYERFLRKLAPTVFHFRIDSGAAVDQRIGIWLDQAVVDKIDIEQITPDSVDAEAGAGRVVYYFAIAESDPFAEITFDLEPSEPGVLHSRVGLVDGPQVEFDQFVYP